jgi:ferredoxin
MTENKPETPKPAVAARKPSPRVAFVNYDQCTGCEACIAVAPWDDCLQRLSFTSGHVACEGEQPQVYGLYSLHEDLSVGCHYDGSSPDRLKTSRPEIRAELPPIAS